MGNEIYDELDELPPSPRIDIPDADLALLERAARAIGAVRVEEVDGEGYVNLHFTDDSVVYSWNPLTFSGDALELAVRLKLSIDIRADAVCVIAGNSNYTVIEKGTGTKLIHAVRRAITRAAAGLET